MPVVRLEAEVIRDAILAVSGRLDWTMYGPSVPTHLTSFMEGRGRPGVSGPLDGNGRKSIYLAVRRNFPNPFLLAFDAPQPNSTIGRRNVSNVPAQALCLLNDPFVLEQAATWATRVLTGSADNRERIRTLYRVGFGREPQAGEVLDALEFLGADSRETHVWAELCHVLLNSKEFIFIK